MQQLRCGCCNKLLLKILATTALVEVKCKCGQLNTFDIKPAKPPLKIVKN